MCTVSLHSLFYFAKTSTAPRTETYMTHINFLSLPKSATRGLDTITNFADKRINRFFVTGASKVGQFIKISISRVI